MPLPIDLLPPSRPSALSPGQGVPNSFESAAVQSAITHAEPLRAPKKRKSAVADLPGAYSDSSLLSASLTQTEVQTSSATRYGRVPRKSRKLTILSDEEDQDTSCSAPDCTVTDTNLPMAVCSGPACGSRVFVSEFPQPFSISHVIFTRRTSAVLV